MNRQTAHVLLLAVLTTHTALVTRIAWNSSPNCDELAHLASGLYHWQTGRFDAFRVNPPLVRMWAALPLAISNPHVAWSTAAASPCSRSEWQLAEDLMRGLGTERVRRALAAGRLMGLLFLWLGALHCYCVAHASFGKASGLVAAALWCFCPNVLAWGATLCPDVPAAALGITAAYYLRVWRLRCRHRDALVAGIWLGLALLAKFSCVVLLVLIPAGALCPPPGTKIARSSLQATLVGLLAWIVLNLGYGFSGWGMRTGELKFCSSLFSGFAFNATTHVDHSQHSWIARTPIPLPADLLRGMDLQKADFERGKRSYLAGRWQNHGWWHYYLVCAIVKLPLGFWVLAVLSGIDAVARLVSSLRTRTPTALRPVLREAGLLLLPAALLLVVASSQTGFSRHFRYVFPCLPFLYVAVSGVVAGYRHALWRVVVLGALTWFIGSSLAVWPWSHSYFNELVGGPAGGHRLLLDSNVDWGEDMYYALSWLDTHPHADPVFRVFVHDDIAPHLSTRWHSAPVPARPGWYLASVHRVLDPADDFHFLSRLVPCDRIAYSTWVYHVAATDLPRERVLRNQDGSRRGAASAAKGQLVSELSRRFTRSRRVSRFCRADGG